MNRASGLGQAGEARQPAGLPSGRSVPAWLPPLVLLAGAVLYLGTLDFEGFWFDEIQTVRGVRRSFADMVKVRLSNGHPPLFFALSWVVVRLGGESEVSLRLLPALMGLLSAVFVYLLGRRLLGDWPGLFAATLLLFSPLQLGIAQQARNYTLVQALLLGASLVLVRTAEDRWREGVRFGLLGTLAAWTHFSALIVVGAQVLGLAIARRWRGAVSGLLAFAMAVPLMIAVLRLTSIRARIGWIDRGDFVPWIHVFARPFVRAWSSWLGDALVLSLSIALLVLGLAGARRLSGHRSLLLAIWIGPPLLALLAELGGAYPTYRVARYFAASWAVAPLLVVAGIWQIGRVWRGGAVALMLIVVGASVPETFVELRDGTSWSGREVAAIIRSEGQESDFLWLHTDRRTDFAPLAYYAGRRVGDLSRRRGWAEGPRRRRGSGRERPEPQAVWIFFRLPEPTEGRALEVYQILNEQFPEREEWPTSRGTLVRLSKSTTDSELGGDR